MEKKKEDNRPIAKEKLAEVKNEVTKTSKDALKILWNRGNVWAVAIGMLIGGAFGAMINSFANDIIVSGIAHAFGINNIDTWVVNGMKVGKFIGTVIALFFIFFSMWAVISLWIFFWNKAIAAHRNDKNKDEKEIMDIEAKIASEMKSLNANIKRLEELKTDNTKK